MLTLVEGPFIAEGESLSSSIDVSAGQLVRITMPENWDEAPLTFQFSSDGTYFNEMYGIDGYAVTIPVVVPGSGVIIPSDVGRAIAHIKFRSGTKGNPVNQSNGRLFAVAIYNEEAPVIEPPVRKAKKKAKAPAKKQRRNFRG